jgi:hypothetical protein
MSLVSESATPPTTPSRPRRSSTRRLWKILGWVTLGHVVVILVMSPQFYCSSGNSPEELLSRGEQAMKDGKYAEAQEYFRKVLDRQPKPPPIYTKAADLHRLADRLGRESAGKASAAAVATSRAGDNRTGNGGAAPKVTSPTTRPPESATPTTRPEREPPTTQAQEPFIPPELRGKK